MVVSLSRNEVGVGLAQASGTFCLMFGLIDSWAMNTRSVSSKGQRDGIGRFISLRGDSVPLWFIQRLLW